jgi:hypothetical protein
MCHVWKPETDFAFRSMKTGKRQSHCRKCHAAYRREHYLKNREAYIAREAARSKSNRIANRPKLREYLLTHPCVDCGEADIVLLEFDHVDPTQKRREVSVLAARKPWHLDERDREVRRPLRRLSPETHGGPIQLAFRASVFTAGASHPDRRSARRRREGLHEVRTVAAVDGIRDQKQEDGQTHHALPELRCCGEPRALSTQPRSLP